MEYTAPQVLLSLFLFVAAGVCEISGGWLIWKWRRDGWHWLFFLLGGLILLGYGLVPTFQKQDFARTYAAYGGFFILLALCWGWALDGDRPDLWDCVGALVALIGVCMIMFVPRR